MTSPKSIQIVFDSGHNEEIILGEPELTQLMTLFEKNGISAQTSAKPIALEEISKFHVVILGNPLDSLFSSQEITNLISYVERGGGLLLLSGASIFGKGGDASRNTNLNMITEHFNFKFSQKAIGFPQLNENRDSEYSDEVIIAIPAAQHPIVQGIRHLQFTTSTAIITETTTNQLFRAANRPGSPVMVVAKSVKEGRVLAMGGTTPLFNEYLSVGDNEIFIVQTIRWLAGMDTSEPVVRIMDTNSFVEQETSEVIADLRLQLNRIEHELETLKDVINSSLKEMEKVLQQFQQKDDEC